MILQSLARNLRQQNWLSLFIELIIVIVGIFVGLQVSSWNSSRQDDAIEKIYLHRLLNDMEESIIGQDEQIESAGSPQSCGISTMRLTWEIQLRPKPSSAHRCSIA